MADDNNKDAVGSGSAILNPGGFALVNANEELVANCVKMIFNSMDDICKCDKCFFDACALVLNQLPPRYVTTYKGALLSQLPQMEAENNRDIVILATHIVKRVSESPQHQ